MAEQAKKSQGDAEPAKVLRIGIVQGGKVQQERLIRPGEAVTIGENSKNTFALKSSTAGKRFVLFQPVGKSDYTLQYTEAMQGKVATDDVIVSLKESAEANRKGPHSVLAVTHKSRGKIQIDDITVLFQFVPAPLESARAAKPDFRARLIEEDDPVFLGFLAVFSALAAVLMIYVHSVEPIDLVSLDDLPERIVTELVIPQKVDTPQEVALPTDEPKRKADTPQETTQPKRQMSAEERAAAEAARQKARQDEVMRQSKLLVAIIGTRGATDSNQAVEDVLSANDNLGSSLDDALKNVGGADMASAGSGGLRSGDKGGTGGSDIGEVGAGGGGSSAVGTGGPVSIKARTSIGGDMDVGAGEGTDLVAATVKKYQNGIKGCYENSLKTNQTLAGRLVIEFDVAAGVVSNVRISENTTGDKALYDCAIKRVRTWRFPETVSVDGVYLPYVLAADAG